MGECFVFDSQPKWKYRKSGWDGKRKPRLATASSIPKLALHGHFYLSNPSKLLKRTRQDGFHLGYVQSIDKVFCTCGISFDLSAKESELDLATLGHGLNLNLVVRVRGNYALLMGNRFTTALIVDLRQENRGDETNAKTYCQTCGRIVHNADLSKAQLFVDEDNQSCLP